MPAFIEEYYSQPQRPTVENRCKVFFLSLLVLGLEISQDLLVYMDYLTNIICYEGLGGF